jgi:hypothetical protein
MDDDQMKQLYDKAEAARRRGEFSPSVGVGVGVDAKRRRLYITKADDEVLLAFTAEQALSLYEGMKHFEARVRQWAAETQQERSRNGRAANGASGSTSG